MNISYFICLNLIFLLTYNQYEYFKPRTNKINPKLRNNSLIPSNSTSTRVANIQIDVVWLILGQFSSFLALFVCIINVHDN